MIFDVLGLRVVESVSCLCLLAGIVAAEDVVSVVCSVFYV